MKPQERIKLLTQQLSDERDLIADLLKSESELKKRITQLEHQLDSAKQDAAQSDVDTVRALHERNELREAYADSQNTITELRRENDSKFSAVCRLREEFADIKKLHADKQTRVLELEFENRALRKERDDLRADNDELIMHSIDY